MPQFDPAYFVSQVFWLILCFAVLLTVICKVAIPRIQSGINRRASYLQDMKTREVVYLEQIEELTKHMHHIKSTHEEKCRHMLESAHHAAAAEKEQELHSLFERFALKRQETSVEMAHELSKMKEKIPELARGIVNTLLEQILSPTRTKGSPIEKNIQRHAIH